jgi:hypothetical protein
LKTVSKLLSKSRGLVKEPDSAEALLGKSERRREGEKREMKREGETRKREQRRAGESMQKKEREGVSKSSLLSSFFTLLAAAATTEEVPRTFESLLMPKSLLRALGELFNRAWVDLFLEFPLSAADRPG